MCCSAELRSCGLQQLSCSASGQKQFLFPTKRAPCTKNLETLYLLSTQNKACILSSCYMPRRRCTMPLPCLPKQSRERRRRKAATTLGGIGRSSPLRRLGLGKSCFFFGGGVKKKKGFLGPAKNSAAGSVFRPAPRRRRRRRLHNSSANACTLPGKLSKAR